MSLPLSIAATRTGNIRADSAELSPPPWYQTHSRYASSASPAVDSDAAFPATPAQQHEQLQHSRLFAPPAGSYHFYNTTTMNHHNITVPPPPSSFSASAVTATDKIEIVEDNVDITRWLEIEDSRWASPPPLPASVPAPSHIHTLQQNNGNDEDDGSTTWKLGQPLHPASSGGISGSMPALSSRTALSDMFADYTHSSSPPLPPSTSSPSTIQPQQPQQPQHQHQNQTTMSQRWPDANFDSFFGGLHAPPQPLSQLHSQSQGGATGQQQNGWFAASAPPVLFVPGSAPPPQSQLALGIGMSSPFQQSHSQQQQHQQQQQNQSFQQNQQQHYFSPANAQAQALPASLPAQFTFGAQSTHSPSHSSFSPSSVDTSSFHDHPHSPLFDFMGTAGATASEMGINPSLTQHVSPPRVPSHFPLSQHAHQMSNMQHQMQGGQQYSGDYLHSPYLMDDDGGMGGGVPWDAGLMDGIDDFTYPSQSQSQFQSHSHSNALGLGLALSPPSSNSNNNSNFNGTFNTSSPYGRGRRLRRRTLRASAGSAVDFELEFDDDGASNASTRHDDEDAVYSGSDVGGIANGNGDISARNNDEQDNDDGVDDDEDGDDNDEDDDEYQDDSDDDEYRPMARRRRVSHTQHQGVSYGGAQGWSVSPRGNMMLSTSAPSALALSSSVSPFGTSSSYQNQTHRNISNSNTANGNGIGSSRRRQRQQGGQRSSGFLGGTAPLASGTTTTGITTYTANGITFADTLPPAGSNSSSSLGSGSAAAPGMSAAYRAASANLQRASGGGTVAAGPSSSSSTVSHLTKRSRGRQVPTVRLVPGVTVPSVVHGNNVDDEDDDDEPRRRRRPSASASASASAERPSMSALYDNGNGADDNDEAVLENGGGDDDASGDADEDEDLHQSSSPHSRSRRSASKRLSSGLDGNRTVRASTRNSSRRIVKNSASLATLMAPSASTSSNTGADGAGTGVDLHSTPSPQQHQQQRRSSASNANSNSNNTNSLGLEMTWSDGRTRAYVCRVNGCGKCFQRGEHLKRHIRSIHTNEKPFKCSHPGCGKDFSRRDNLLQHLTIHQRYSAQR